MHQKEIPEIILIDWSFANYFKHYIPFNYIDLKGT